jgi:hypothetical protein
MGSRQSLAAVLCVIVMGAAGAICWGPVTNTRARATQAALA